MAVIKDHVSVSAVLQTAASPAATFDNTLFLVDDAQVPIDVRRRTFTSTGWDDDMTAATDPYYFANVYFAQKRVPSQLMVGRWVSSASSPHFICGAHETDYTVWESVSTGTFTVTDGTNTDDVTGVDFTGITALSQVATVLTAKLDAIAVPNITGLKTAVFAFDALDRLVITNSTTGAAAAGISIVSEGNGVDLTTSTYMDVDTGVAVDGLDAEEPIAALAAISAIDDGWWGLATERSLSIAQQVAVSTYIAAKPKGYVPVVSATNAKSSAIATDAGYLIAALAHKRTMCLYSEWTTEWPDAAVLGCVLPATEGSTSFAFETLASVQQSGKSGSTAIPLTSTERTNLAAKNYNWIEKIGDNIYLYDGITSGGEELRIMLARDWFVARIEEGIFAIQLNQPIMAFDNSTLALVEGVIRQYGTEAIARKIGVDTAARPFTVTMPDADDFTTAERLSHTMTLDDVFVLYLNSSINDYAITGTWTI